uniref:Uncharacterized protein n=1 Tax=Avena sativa TaxID=4498 RepID=A0ACD5WPQ1_AVESA
MDSPSSVTSNPFATSSSPVTLPAATIQLINIKQHVPVVLDLTQPNYSTWSTFFMVAFRKFGVQDHIDGTVDARHRQYDAEWIQIDYSIVSWLYTSVSQEIVDIILKPDDTAFGVWTAIHNIFLGNRNQRAVYALQEFHNLYQGDTSITAYFGLSISS